MVATRFLDMEPPRMGLSDGGFRGTLPSSRRRKDGGQPEGSGLLGECTRPLGLSAQPTGPPLNAARDDFAPRGLSWSLRYHRRKLRVYSSQAAEFSTN